MALHTYRRLGSVFQIRVIITNTNPALPLWLTSVFGGNVVTRVQSNPKWKDAYTWSCTAAKAAWILHNCMPWLLLKRAQAELVLSMQERIDQTRRGRGLSLSQAERELRSDIHEQVKALNMKGPK